MRTPADIFFDTYAQSRIAGFRGGSSLPGRQFVLRDQQFDIHIKISSKESLREIHGQLLARAGAAFVAAAQCHLLRNGVRFESTTTDEIGEFHFTRIPEGDLYIQIDLPDLTIVGSLNPEENP
jgi:hypothetical protein